MIITRWVFFSADGNIFLQIVFPLHLPVQWDRSLKHFNMSTSVKMKVDKISFEINMKIDNCKVKNTLPNVTRLKYTSQPEVNYEHSYITHLP